MTRAVDLYTSQTIAKVGSSSALYSLGFSLFVRRAHFSKLKNQSNYWRTMYVGMVCLYGYLSLVNYVEREREARERGPRDL